jgi:small subunit ribosomal protein S11
VEQPKKHQVRLKRLKMAEEAVKPVDEAELTKAAEAEASEEAPKKAPAKKKKAKRTVAHGHIHVLATFNNTIITVTDPKGNVLSTASAGASGFRGSKKGTAYAAQVASEKAITVAKQANGLSKADVFVKGVGQGRDAAVRTLINQRVQIESVKDVTPVAHGGVRPRKAKRN